MLAQIVIADTVVDVSSVENPAAAEAARGCAAVDQRTRGLLDLVASAARTLDEGEYTTVASRYQADVAPIAVARRALEDAWSAGSESGILAAFAQLRSAASVLDDLGEYLEHAGNAAARTRHRAGELAAALAKASNRAAGLPSPQAEPLLERVVESQKALNRASAVAGRRAWLRAYDLVVEAEQLAGDIARASEGATREPQTVETSDRERLRSQYGTTVSSLRERGSAAVLHWRAVCATSPAAVVAAHTALLPDAGSALQQATTILSAPRLDDDTLATARDLIDRAAEYIERVENLPLLTP